MVPQLVQRLVVSGLTFNSLEQNKLGRGQAATSGTCLSDTRAPPLGLKLLNLGGKLAGSVKVEKVSGGALRGHYFKFRLFRLPPSQLVLVLVGPLSLALVRACSLPF